MGEQFDDGMVGLIEVIFSENFVRGGRHFGFCLAPPKVCGGRRGFQRAPRRDSRRDSRRESRRATGEKKPDTLARVGHWGRATCALLARGHAH